MPIVDAHLDLAYNALRGRAVEQPAAEQAPDEDGIPSVGLPDLRAGGVDLCCATIYCSPASNQHPGYRTADEAHAMALQQIDWYRQRSGLHLVRDRDLAGDRRAILLLEGADPIRHAEDAREFFQAGVRIVGLAWRRTRYAGGTGEPGPLTEEGVKLVKTLDELGIIHDASHLAEASFWQLLQISEGPVMASHSNCRAFVPTDRQLSDEMIRAVIQRGGVIGINFFDKFLLTPSEYGKRRATLEDVVHHMRHICELAGNAEHVAIGTDMDGGFGRDEIPQEIRTSADLPRVAEALSEAGFGDGEVARIMEGNWRRFLERNLARG